MQQELFIAAVALVAGLVQGTIGFGAGLIAAPFLLASFSGVAAVQLLVALNLAATVALVPSLARHAPAPAVVRLCAGALLGLPLGLAALSLASTDALRVAIALAIVAMITALWRPTSAVAPAGTGSGRGLWLPGVLAGLLSSSIGAPGPPLFWGLRRTGHGKRTVRAVLIVTMACIYFGAAVAHAVGRGLEVAPASAGWVMVGAVAGARAGHLLADRFSERIYRLAGIGLLAGTAVALLGQVIGSR